MAINTQFEQWFVRENPCEVRSPVLLLHKDSRDEYTFLATRACMAAWNARSLAPATGHTSDTDSWIVTSSGGTIDLLNPDHEDIHLADIAHSLSNSCRYNGHCRFHYSVAQHSVYVSYLVPESQALEALMHDAAEAYLSDVVRPLKKNVPFEGYLESERRMEKAIQKRFGLGPLDTPAIKMADMRVLLEEKRQIVPETGRDWMCLAGVKPAPELIIERMQPEEAAQMFLTRFAQLAPTMAA